MASRPQIWRFATFIAIEAIACASVNEAVSAGEVDALLFGSLDAGAAQYLTLGAKLGLDSLDRDGFVALASVGGGRRVERVTEGPRQRYTAGSAAVFGYQWFFDWGVIAAYAGPEVTADMLVGVKGFIPSSPYAGLRLQGEIWVRPSEATLVQGSAVAGSARDSLWVRVAWGYRLWGAYLGPEVGAYGDATGYRKWALGLHGTDFDVSRFSARLSVGLQTESGRRTAAPYVSLSAWTPW
ncbi:cellulose biosynthesis protein BcsS [Methylobacterium mesophilicum]|uniref:cellulose biosynthesis protein BcsS n=1 Tax=Methylobacterium mesophilicum TaxID=39956 RepID=UPI0002C60C7A|nr:cellulose biosynthesis protein BcsS [Methylobacterium mesophilicum]